MRKREKFFLLRFSSTLRCRNLYHEYYDNSIRDRGIPSDEDFTPNSEYPILGHRIEVKQLTSTAT